MEEKELDPGLDFSDLIYDYENRVPCGAASGRPLPQQQIVQADEQCSPLHFFLLGLHHRFVSLLQIPIENVIIPKGCFYGFLSNDFPVRGAGAGRFRKRFDARRQENHKTENALAASRLVGQSQLVDAANFHRTLRKGIRPRGSYALR